MGRKFLGHEKDVVSDAFSPDNSHVVSGSRDNKLKVWNVKGDCVFFLDWDAHTDCLQTDPRCSVGTRTVRYGDVDEYAD